MTYIITFCPFLPTLLDFGQFCNHVIVPNAHIDSGILNYSTLDHLDVYYNLGAYCVAHIQFCEFSYPT